MLPAAASVQAGCRRQRWRGLRHGALHRPAPPPSLSQGGDLSDCNRAQEGNGGEREWKRRSSDRGVEMLSDSSVPRVSSGIFLPDLLLETWVSQEWKCNGRSYTAYRNFIRRPRNQESQSSTPGDRLVLEFPCVELSPFLWLLAPLYAGILLFFLLSKVSRSNRQDTRTEFPFNPCPPRLLLLLPDQSG